MGTPVVSKSPSGMIASTVAPTVAEILREEGPHFTGWVGQSPIMALALGQAGFDALTLDMQHGRIDLAGVLQGIPLIHGTGRPSIVRITVGEFQTASRVLDAGATGIIAPMINSATDAASLVEYCKYPPLGTRSWGPYVALPQSGLTAAEYLRAANYETIVLAMIETRTALDAIDEILAVDGIDGVFVGPSDLSIALSAGQGIGPNSEPVLVALDLVVRMARAAGKYTGVFAETGDWARMAAGVGFDLIAVGNDSSLLMLAAHQELEIARRL